MTYLLGLVLSAIAGAFVGNFIAELVIRYWRTAAND